MSELLIRLSKIEAGKHVSKPEIVERILGHISLSEYDLHSVDDQRPWGAFFRIVDEHANAFIEEFFPEISPAEARLGREDVELSPKILLVEPEQRLSLQYHERRAERWRFITEGSYVKSMTDETDEVQVAEAGHVVQFEPGERHRLIGHFASHTIVAEIWQHMDPNDPSSEDDIVRLQDDYKRD